MSRLKVILPAAGQGTRLNLPYPKEIMRLDANTALIDHSMRLFSNQDRNAVEFVVVINEHKTDLVKYLARYKDRYNISFVYQNPNEQEYTGAIKSAAHLFGEHNIVLLPDTILTLEPGVDLYSLVMQNLTATGFVFLYKPCGDENMLRTKGALTVDSDKKVQAYVDKPTVDVEQYNAYWCAFAFRRRAFNSCIDFMEKSTLRQTVDVDAIKSTPIYGSLAIPVLDYVDLGTWPEIRRVINDQDNN